MDGKTYVYVFGPEGLAIGACIKLKQKGYDAHMGVKRSVEKMACVRASDVVLRVGDDRHDDAADSHVEAYAREQGKPVYRSLDQLCVEVKAAKKAETMAPRSRAKKFKR
jgi:hypothetical protein